MRTVIALVSIIAGSLALCPPSQAAAATDSRPTLAQHGNQDARPESEPTEAAFGKKRQWVLQPATSFALFRSSAGDDLGRMKSQSTEATISLDHFFSDRLSLGLVAGYQRARWDSIWSATPVDGAAGQIVQSESRSWTGSAGLAAGWNRPLGRWASFWPRTQALLGYGKSSDGQAPGMPAIAPRDQAHWSLALEATAAVLIHPVPHFFIGAGPRLSVNVVRFELLNQQTVAVGLAPAFILGGWL